MNIRDIRQEQWSETWINSSRKSILYLCPRAGKVRTSIKIMNKLKYKKVLIAYPREDIKIGWISDFREMGFDESTIEFVTFNSLKHKVNNSYDLFIIDEIHEGSLNFLKLADKIVEKTDTLGLSGTLTKKTQEEISKTIGITPCHTYLIEEGVKEGILCDYSINIHKVPLDNIVKTFKQGTKTEKRQFDALEYVKTSKNKWMIELKQISLLQNSLAKLKKTRELINKYEDQRLLIFTGVIDIANKLEVPVYHSKNKDKEIFTDFCRGVNYKHLACCKMLQSGITISPINRGIMNYISGSTEDTAQKISRFLGYEYSSPDKKAYIDIISSDEKFELQRINSGLLFFNPNKITYIN